MRLERDSGVPRHPRSIVRANYGLGASVDVARCLLPAPPPLPPRSRPPGLHPKQERLLLARPHTASFKCGLYYKCTDSEWWWGTGGLQGPEHRPSEQSKETQLLPAPSPHLRHSSVQEEYMDRHHTRLQN